MWSHWRKCVTGVRLDFFKSYIILSQLFQPRGCVSRYICSQLLVQDLAYLPAARMIVESTLRNWKPQSKHFLSYVASRYCFITAIGKRDNCCAPNKSLLFHSMFLECFRKPSVNTGFYPLTHEADKTHSTYLTSISQPLNVYRLHFPWQCLVTATEGHDNYNSHQSQLCVITGVKNSKYLPPASGIERHLKAPWPLSGNHIISEINACFLSVSFLVFLSSDKAGAESKTETNNTSQGS